MFTYSLICIIVLYMQLYNGIKHASLLYVITNLRIASQVTILTSHLMWYKVKSKQCYVVRKAKYFAHYSTSYFETVYTLNGKLYAMQYASFNDI